MYYLSDQHHRIKTLRTHAACISFSKQPGRIDAHHTTGDGNPNSVHLE